MKPSKYKNIPTVIDNIRFASKAEASYYSLLKILKKAGEVSDFQMQVTYTLTAGIKYILDFKVFYANGNIEHVDIKGMKPTPVFRLKAKLMAHDHGIKIKCLRRITDFSFKEI